MGLPSLLGECGMTPQYMIIWMKVTAQVNHKISYSALLLVLI